MFNEPKKKKKNQTLHVSYNIGWKKHQRETIAMWIAMWSFPTNIILYVLKTSFRARQDFAMPHT